MKPTIVIGHKNPDTDSICSAICYADLRRRLTGDEYIPCRCGEVNSETAYVLETFGVEAPRLVTSLEPTIADVQYREVEGINPRLTLKRAWEQMRDQNIQTVPVLTKRGKIRGIITLGDEARFYMEDQDPRVLSKANTPYANIAQTLWGEIAVGDPDALFTKGKVVVAAAHPSVIEDNIAPGDTVIVGNHLDTQRYAIEKGAGCIVICVGSKVPPSVRKRAEESGCVVILSPMDIYTCAKLINQSLPVAHIMRKDGIITFGLDEFVADVKSTVSKLRIRYFPVLDHNDCYVGMLSQRNLLDFARQRVILVDHNERGQAVDGIRFADVAGIIDHHRIDSVDTANPIYFRNQPVGCTATIIAMMYAEHGLVPEPTIAALLCSAIISDTLMFRSPTCTPVDEQFARSLADQAGIDITEHATAMFNAGSDYSTKTPDELFHTDCKSFNANKTSLTVSQITGVSGVELARLKDKMPPYMEKLLAASGVDMLFMMLTNIIEESTELLFVGQGARAAVANAFEVEPQEHSVVLPGVVSRKKQVIAPLMAALDEM